MKEKSYIKLTPGEAPEKDGPLGDHSDHDEGQAQGREAEQAIKNLRQYLIKDHYSLGMSWIQLGH